MLPALLMIGAGLQVYSQYTGNMSQASSEIENAKFYEIQSQYALEAMSREANLTKRKYSATMGAQLGALAKGNVSLSEGSSLGILANTLSQKTDELIAIRKKGELEANLAKGRATQAYKTAHTLKDPFYNALQAGGSLLTAYAVGKGA